jgi:hypothetical protein
MGCSSGQKEVTFISLYFIRIRWLGFHLIKIVCFLRYKMELPYFYLPHSIVYFNGVRQNTQAYFLTLTMRHPKHLSKIFPQIEEQLICVWG